jgi:hypothetical protein
MGPETRHCFRSANLVRFTAPAGRSWRPFRFRAAARRAVTESAFVEHCRCIPNIVALPASQRQEPSRASSETPGFMNRLSKGYVPMKVNARIRIFMLAVCAGGSILVFCKQPGMGFSYMQGGEIKKVELLNKETVAFSSTDTSKIRQFVTFLLSASQDNSGQNFKSWNFAKLYTDKGEFFRIEMFENFFRIKGIRFAQESEVLAKFKAIFGLP